MRHIEVWPKFCVAEMSGGMKGLAAVEKLVESGDICPYNESSFAIEVKNEPGSSGLFAEVVSKIDPCSTCGLKPEITHTNSLEIFESDGFDV